MIGPSRFVVNLVYLHYMRLILCFFYKLSVYSILLSLYVQSQELDLMILVGPFQLRISYDSSVLPCLWNLPQCDTPGSCEMYLVKILRYLCTLSSAHSQQTRAPGSCWLLLPQNCLILLFSKHALVWNVQSLVLSDQQKRADELHRYSKKTWEILAGQRLR